MVNTVKYDVSHIALQTAMQNELQTAMQNLQTVQICIVVLVHRNQDGNIQSPQNYYAKYGTQNDSWNIVNEKHYKGFCTNRCINRIKWELFTTKIKVLL